MCVRKSLFSAFYSMKSFPSVVIPESFVVDKAGGADKVLDELTNYVERNRVNRAAFKHKCDSMLEQLDRDIRCVKEREIKSYVLRDKLTNDSTVSEFCEDELMLSKNVREIVERNNGLKTKLEEHCNGKLNEIADLNANARKATIAAFPELRSKIVSMMNQPVPQVKPLHERLRVPTFN